VGLLGGASGDETAKFNIIEKEEKEKQIE